MISPALSLWDRFPPPAPRSPDRPALTALALLAAANPQVAEQLLHNPLEAARAHPHYIVHLDDADRVVLARIRASARSVREFLLQLADAIDDANERTLAPASD
jgi:uncharacterized protein (DUF302 family)